MQKPNHNCVPKLKDYTVSPAYGSTPHCPAPAELALQPAHRQSEEPAAPIIATLQLRASMKTHCAFKLDCYLYKAS